MGLGVWYACVPSWLSEAGGANPPPPPLPGFCLTQGRSLLRPGRCPQGAQPGEEARPQTGRQRAAPKVPEGRLSPGNSVPRRPRGKTAWRRRAPAGSLGQRWRCWRPDFGARACQEQRSAAAGPVGAGGRPERTRAAGSPAPRTPDRPRPGSPGGQKPEQKRPVGRRCVLSRRERGRRPRGQHAGCEHARRPAGLPRASAGGAPPAESAGESAPPDHAGAGVGAGRAEGEGRREGGGTGGRARSETGVRHLWPVSQTWPALLFVQLRNQERFLHFVIVEKYEEVNILQEVKIT